MKSHRTSKSRRTYKEVDFNKRRPRNLAAWKRVVGFKVGGMQVHARDSHYRNGWVRRREAGRVSGLVTALEISPPSKFRRRVQQLEIKSRRGEISRKYGNYYSMKLSREKTNFTVSEPSVKAFSAKFGHAPPPYSVFPLLYLNRGTTPYLWVAGLQQC